MMVIDELGEGKQTLARLIRNDHPSSRCCKESLEANSSISFSLYQISCLGQVEVVFKTISNPDSKLFDDSTCRNNKCNLKIKVTFNEPDTQS